MTANVSQLAWYIERDGASVDARRADGTQLVRVPALGGHLDYIVPAHMVDALNAERDRVYRVLAEKRRKAAAR